VNPRILAVNWLTDPTRRLGRPSTLNLAQRRFSTLAVAVGKQFSPLHMRPLGNKVPFRKSAAHFYARAALLNVSLGSLYGAGKGDFGSGMTLCRTNDEGER
jgi:hypothetical protein